MTRAIRLHRREPQARESERQSGSFRVVEVVLEEGDGGLRRVLDAWTEPGAVHALALGFVPGERFAWAWLVTTCLGDHDCDLFVFPLDAPYQPARLRCDDRRSPEDVRFAPDGSALYRRFHDEAGLRPPWVERTPLPPDGTSTRLDAFPKGAVTLGECAFRGWDREG